MLASPFRPLYKSISLRLLLLLHFLRESHLSFFFFFFFFCFLFFQYFSHTPSFKAIIASYSYKPSSSSLNFFNFFLKKYTLGIPNTSTIFQTRANKSFISCLFYMLRTLIKISSQETKCSICVSTHVANICIQSRHV